MNEERNSEWQANTFAGNFLAPSKFLRKTITPIELALSFDFPLEYAEDYLSNKAILTKKYDPEPCSECSNFTLARDG
ncbi:MAG TPA: hypothetical protein VJY15_24370, partial [Candidatus Acidoferrum sp.]|nr:hypothetical protein [Candidatus Acidoferrum sp.]